jgi:hypothetical protein
MEIHAYIDQLHLFLLFFKKVKVIRAWHLPGHAQGRAHGAMRPAQWIVAGIGV